MCDFVQKVIGSGNKNSLVCSHCNTRKILNLAQGSSVSCINYQLRKESSAEQDKSGYH